MDEVILHQTQIGEFLNQRNGIFTFEEHLSTSIKKISLSILHSFQACFISGTSEGIAGSELVYGSVSQALF